MAKYSYHQVDQNAEALYEFAEAQGFSIERIGRPLDALVCCWGVTAIAEVKTAKGTIRPSQAKFMREWPGRTFVWRSEEDVLKAKETLYSDATVIREG